MPKAGRALPVTKSESKKYGVKTGQKYREGRISYTEKKWGGRRYNKQASPIVGEKSGGTALEQGRIMGVYKKKNK